MAFSTIGKKAFAFVLSAAIVAANCPDRSTWKNLEGLTSERTININGQNRTYLLHIPQDFTKNNHQVGYVFSYHDASKDAYHQEEISGFSDPALNNKYLAVYPQALKGTWYPGRSSGGNYSDPRSTNPQDHIFTSAIIDDLYAQKGLCLDRTQAYATGMGNGSSFVHHLNCRNGHEKPFQAFAGISGVPHTLDMQPNRCFSPGFRPITMIHGTNDKQYTNITGIITMPPVNERTLAAVWARKGGFPNHQRPDFTEGRFVWNI